MNELSLISVFSGSSGNCTAIHCNEDTILFDAGRSSRAIERGLCERGISPESVRAVFITHEHTDHISALAVFTKKYRIPVYAACGTADAIACKCCGELYRMPQIFETVIGNMTVRSFPTSHDARCSVGYRVDVFGTSVGIATDTGIVTPAMRTALSGCAAVLLESNHDPQMLKCGPYPPELKKRVASRLGHLSNKKSSEFAAELALSGTRKFILAHISKENNLPELALASIRKALESIAPEAQIEIADAVASRAVTIETDPLA